MTTALAAPLTLYARVRRILFYLTVTVVLMRIARLFYRLRAASRRLKALPGPPLGASHEDWLLGHLGMPDMFGTLRGNFTPENAQRIVVEKLLGATKRYGEKGVCRMFGINSSVPGNVIAFVFVTNMETAREILSAKTLPNIRKGLAYEISERLIGQSVLHASHAAW